MSRICLYYRIPRETDRWFPFDRYMRPWIRRAIRGKPKKGGVDKVFNNLCLGLDRLGVSYVVNIPFNKLVAGDRIGVLGRGRECLEGYRWGYPIVAGIGLMTHPTEWPDLCDQYPVTFYLQHSDWANEVYKPFFGDRCRTWAVGIDTKAWRPSSSKPSHDFLIYDKVHWERETRVAELLEPIREELGRRGLTFETLRYGHYSEAQYRQALARCRAMIYLSEHESQGLAYLEALASGVPILAWDQGKVLDPCRFQWGQPDINATSVPFFDARCGRKFVRMTNFGRELDLFLKELSSKAYKPRDFVLENLTLEKCSQQFLDLLEQAAAQPIAKPGSKPIRA
jgi:hypothetical protein